MFTRYTNTYYKIEAIQFSMKQMDGFIILARNLENILKKKENV